VSRENKKASFMARSGELRIAEMCLQPGTKYEYARIIINAAIADLNFIFRSTFLLIISTYKSYHI
jgi:hypothetical protein